MAASTSRCSDRRSTKHINAQSLLNDMQKDLEDSSSFDDSDLDPSYEPDTDGSDAPTKSINHSDFNEELQNTPEAVNGGILIMGEMNEDAPPQDTTNDLSQIPEAAVTVFDEANFTSPEYDGRKKKRASRRRVRRENTRKRFLRKKLRNSGKEYYTSNNKKKQSRQMKVTPDHKCRSACLTKIDIEKCHKIFSIFWNLNDFDKQNNFIVSSVITGPVKQRTNKNADTSRRQTSRVFHFDGKVVCKDFFLKTLDVSNGRLDRAIKRKIPDVGPVCKVDQRGRHTPPNKTPADVVAHVKAHIEEFPAFVSHYSRRDNVKKKYLSPNLNISKMHNLYKERCLQANINCVSEACYRSIFNEDYNLSFYTPKKDTCSKCDRMIASIHIANDANEKKALELKKQVHLRKAEKARESKKQDTEKAKTGNTCDVITFDLQKVLVTPLLETNEAYYKRQLSTYNFGIHTKLTGTATMNVWHEGEGGRGAQEVGTCLLKYVSSLPTNIDHIIAYSDSCGGQNRNEKVAKFWMFIVLNTHIKMVDHKFMEPGHSFLENDTDFSLIEKSKRKGVEVSVPDDWLTLIADCRKTKKFKTVKLSHSDFFSVDNMTAATVNRKLDVNKENFNWLRIRWMRFDSTKPLQFLFKETLQEDDTFRTVDFARKRGRNAAAPPPTRLTQLYKGRRAIKKAKWTDLQRLAEFLKNVNHRLFYYNLRCAGDDEDDTEEDEALTEEDSDIET